MKHDDTYYSTHNAPITTSGDCNTRSFRIFIENLRLERCLYAIGKSLERALPLLLTAVDTPYDDVEEARAWWDSINLSEDQKEVAGRPMRSVSSSCLLEE
jgi:hypothetical protein